MKYQLLEIPYSNNIIHKPEEVNTKLIYETSNFDEAVLFSINYQTQYKTCTLLMPNANPPYIPLYIKEDGKAYCMGIEAIKDEKNN